MNWRELEAMTDNIVLGAFDEAIRHSPKKDGRLDPERQKSEIRGVLHNPSVDSPISPGGGFRTTISGSATMLVINRSDYPELLLAKGDSFRALERAGMPCFELAEVSSHVSGAMILTLARLG